MSTRKKSVQEKNAPSVSLFQNIKETVIKYNNKLPHYYYVFPILFFFWYMLYLSNLLTPLLAWYAFCAFFSPHSSVEPLMVLTKRSLRPYPGYPWYYGIVGLSILASRVFLVFPFETIFYYLDEIFFSGYKSVQIKNPFFVLGQPRSGTTKFESILDGDNEIVCMKLYEARWPYLSFQYGIDLICYVDQKFLGGAIERFVRDYDLLNALDESDPERHKMRRLRYDLADEDDLIFLFHFFIHFQLVGPFPDPDVIEYLHHFEYQSTYERRRMMEFHKKAVQKLLYRRGTNKTYFAKWVAAWDGELDEALNIYKDAKLVVFVRNPADQIKSWIKLQGLLSRDITGTVSVDNPAVLAQIKKENRIWYENEVKLLKSYDASKIKLVKFDDYYGDIQGNTRDLYKFLGRDIKEGSKFDLFLKQQTQQQLGHRATVTDSKYIGEEEIKTFPNLPVVLFSEKAKKTE